MNVFGIEGITIDDSHNIIYKGISVITIEELHDYCEINDIMPGVFLKKLCQTTAIRDLKIDAITA